MSHSGLHGKSNLLRSLLPDSVKRVLEKGINLYSLHTKRHGRNESFWVAWEKRLIQVFFRNTEYLTSIQAPFELAVNQVLEHLKRNIKGDYVKPITGGLLLQIFAAIDVHVAGIRNLLFSSVEIFFTMLCFSMCGLEIVNDIMVLLLNINSY
ncbi:RNAligase [Artemisia annua]|uniref:RNAligase n=1 Tax=Artemisia annua TaxID=35608 RepID=A0A2U1PJL5_ARTAN|nr:RNAligase [Artemisia annua]